MGGTKQFKYPLYVWSPSGGWWCNPRYWRRNTVIAFGAIGVISAGVWYISAQLERRPVAPYRPIPSQRWCKYAKKTHQQFFTIQETIVLSANSSKTNQYFTKACEDDPRLRTN